MNIKSKALLAYVVIFLLGGASGFFLSEAIEPQFPRDDFERRPGMSRDFSFEQDGEFQQRMRNFLIKKLDLQENQIEPFFEIQSEHLREVIGLISERKSKEMDILRENYADFINDVDGILTDEQISELNSFAHPDSIHQRRMQRRNRRDFK